MLQVLGTPTEDNWPGISRSEELAGYKFPAYAPETLVSKAPRLDTDGIALSSRNRYLTPPLRQRALSLSGALRAMQAALNAHGPGIPAAELLAVGHSVLDFDEFDYLHIVDPDTLQDVTTVDRPVRALVGGYIGGTRLIDNMALVP